jgi:HK97 family phage major capsid protein
MAVKKTDTRKLIGKKLKRNFALQRADMKIDEKARTVEMSFSSDEAIEHWFGKLILNHAPAAIRLQRLRDGGPLLLDHDRTKQIGVHERVETDGHKMRGLVRFSKGTLGEEIFQDVVDQIRRNASCGFIVHELHLVREDDDGPVYQSDDWEPVEDSIVAIAADTSVGVGRAMEAGDVCEECDGEGCDLCKPGDEQEQSKNSSAESGRANNQPTEVRNAMDPKDKEKTGEPTELERAQELIEYGKLFGAEDLARDLASEGKGLPELRAAISAKRKNAQPPNPTEDPGQVAARQGGQVQIARGAYGRLKSFRGERAHEQAYRFGMFMLAGVFARVLGEQSPKLLKKATDFCREQGIAITRAHSESDNESGGVLVPTEFENVMIDLREQFGIFRRFANIVPMATDSKQRPRRKGGLKAYPIGAKGGSRRITESKKNWDMVELFARKWGVLAKYEEELNEDAIVMMADDLAGEIAYAFTETEDECGFNGDGTSDFHGITGAINKIKGLSGTVGNIAGLIVASGNNWDAITRGDMLRLIGRLPQYADTPNARFFCHKTFWSEVLERIILEGGGTTAAEMQGQRVKVFQGYQVEIAQVLPKSTASGQIPLLFGDLAKAAMLGDRRGVTIKLTDSNDTDFEEDLISIKGTERFDINVHDVGNASATAANREAGPLVALITQ